MFRININLDYFPSRTEFVPNHLPVAKLDNIIQVILRDIILGILNICEMHININSDTLLTVAGIGTRYQRPTTRGGIM